MSKPTVRAAAPPDVAAIAAIYRPAVLTGTASFELEVTVRLGSDAQFSAFDELRRARRASAPASIEVKPLPAGAPPGFEAVNEMSGYSVKVGKGATAAKFQLPNVAGVRKWLYSAVEQRPAAPMMGENHK